jgi:Zn-dependent metalloprotease
LLRKKPKRAARIFLRRYLSLLGMPNADRELVLNRKTKDAIGMTHIRLKQVYKGVPVYGAEVVVHYQPGAKKVFALNGTFIPYLALKTQPTIDSDAALAIVREIQDRGALWEEPLLRIYSGHIDPAVWGNHLVWMVRIYDESEPSRNLYVVDAHTGKVLTTYDELNDARNRVIHDAENTSDFTKVLVRSEGQGVTGDTDTDNAYDFLGATYDYFLIEHNRDSYDDSGATLRATVHYCSFIPVPQCPFLNAFWNGSRMVFGDGFTVDDVTAHELSHAVTEHTAGLIYRNQSGALNESYSDIFGEIVDLDWATGNDNGDQDWLMGEDIPGFGAIRDMSDPPAFGDPDKVSNYDCTPFDNGGVHTNSGIPNKAAYLMAQGGNFNGENITGIGRVKMGQVQYRALSEYLVASSDFVDYYLLMNQSCVDLYGAGSPECLAVNNALLAVEMNIEPDCGGNGGWLSAYPTLLDAPSDLKMMRQYRDEVLVKTSRGRLYKGLLYRNSEKALAVLKTDPELMARASGLIHVNKDAISDVLAGQEGVIYNTDEIVAFLGDYAQKSPPGVKFFVKMVGVAMMKKKKQGKLFLGFRLE